jgi:hypothetical protein
MRKLSIAYAMKLRMKEVNFIALFINKICPPPSSFQILAGILYYCAVNFLISTNISN